MSAPTLPPEPDQRLAGRALLGWMLGGAGSGVVALVIVLTALRDTGVFGVALAAALVFLLGAAVVVPLLRYRTWRYAAREEEIDLRHGAWVVRRTIIPMARVQHVDTSVTPFGQVLGIATLTVHTAAGRHSIPGLDAREADRLRAQIARSAREPDVV